MSKSKSRKSAAVAKIKKSFNVRIELLQDGTYMLGFVWTCRKKGNVMEWGNAAPTDIAKLARALGSK